MTGRKREAMSGLMFAAPFLFGFAAFFVVPFLISVVFTFTKNANGLKFAGLDNYIDLFGSSAFQTAAYNTFRFILIGVPLIMVLSTLLALLLHKRFLGSSFYRSVFLYPLVVPVAATVMVFQLVFAESGVINTIYAWLGLPIENWLASDHAFYVLMILYLWKNCGYNIVLIMAGLNSIPHAFHEAAQVEGANRWQILRHITIPLLAPSFFFVFVVSIINSFKCFREAFLLGGSIPHKSIYMLQHFMNNNFTNLNYQRLSTAAFLVFIVIFALVFVLFWMRRKAGDIQL